MKHLGIALALTLFITAVSSCKIDDGGNKPRITWRGLVLYGVTTDNVIFDYLTALDVSVKLDQIITEETRLEKENLEDTYFPSNKLRFSEDGMTCRISPDIAEIATGGASLSTPGTIWKCVIYGNIFQVECLEEGKYQVSGDKVTSKANNLISSKARFTVEVADNFLLSFTGDGEYEDSGAYPYSTVRFTCDPSVTCTRVPQQACFDSNSHYKYYQGNLTMTISGEAITDGSEEVRALLSTSRGETKVTISYRGFSEDWSLR